MLLLSLASLTASPVSHSPLPRISPCPSHPLPHLVRVLYIVQWIFKKKIQTQQNGRSYQSPFVQQRRFGLEKKYVKTFLSTESIISLTVSVTSLFSPFFPVHLSIYLTLNNLHSHSYHTHVRIKSHSLTYQLLLC